jgi:hypothetical protein
VHKVHLLYERGGGVGGASYCENINMLNNNARKECVQYTVEDLHLGKVEHIFMDYKASKDMMAYSAPLMKI